MSPALARIKRAVNIAIGHNGGIYGAAATVGLKHTVVGDWHNLNKKTIPIIEYIIALDEVSVAVGELPPVTCAMARHMGGVFVPAIDISAADGSPAFLAMQLAQTLGAVSGEIAHALADDGRIDHREAARVLDRLQEHDRTSAQLRQQLEKILAEGE